MTKLKVLVTGSAGFIGFHVYQQLRAQGADVLGLDSINDYYDIRLKFGRLRESGFDTDDISTGKICAGRAGGRFLKLDLTEREQVQELFQREKFDMVCHLAAQPGVRYSIQNPYAYIDSNISAFLNIMEGCRHNAIRHLVYASSSSVYGNNAKVPFSVSDRVDQPVSLYAATKKSNELMAYCYSSLYHIPMTGLRFFTVYGPWGRADMAMFKFTRAILEGEKVQVFNHGMLKRDFTYVDDIVDGVCRVLVAPEKIPQDNGVPYHIYNIGHGQPVPLMDFIRAIERAVGKKALLEYMDMQPGDVNETWADTGDLQRDFGYAPATDIESGIQRFVAWYRNFYQL